MRVTALELFAVPPRWLFLKENADLLDYVVDESVFEVVDGFVAVPSGHGLGVEIDEERVREAARGARTWHNPVWRNDDGTVAEW